MNTNQEMKPTDYFVRHPRKTEIISEKVFRVILHTPGI